MAIKKEFKMVFQLSKMVVFEVNYYTLGSNKHPYFTTSACKFVKNKKDYSRCGQAQESLLWGKAMTFYKKWDELHLQDLTDEQYEELIKDISVLKETYNYIENDGKYNISFYATVQLSKMTPKKENK